MVAADNKQRLDADGLLAFYERAGFAVHRSDNAWWYQAGPRFLLAVPPHRAITLPSEEVRRVLRATGAFGLRYVAADNQKGLASWRVVLDQPDYDLSKLSANTRSKVRRGLKQNVIRRVSGAELKRCGEQAFRDTVDRQGRGGRYGLERWHRLLDAADATPGIEIWGAWNGERLAAYLLIMVFDDACEFYEARSRNDTLRSYPNNALIYHVARELLRERAIPRISFGIEGLEELDSLDEFKRTMGFEREPIVQRAVFHPLLQTVLAQRPIRTLVGRLADHAGPVSLWRRVHSLTRMADFESN